MELLLETFLLACVLLERVVLLPAEGFARRLVFRPAARVLARAALPFVELDDTRDRPVEEVAVVRDDHGGAVRVSDETLEPRKAVEVEVVRRLVEEEDVEARKQGRRELDAGELAARQVAESRGRVVLHFELGADGSRTRGEVRTAEREVALERMCVRLDRLRIVGDLRRQAIELFPRGRDSAPACEVLLDGLVRVAVSLLREISDREVGRRAADSASVHFLQPGEDAQQRRLPDAVRADEPDPRTRRNDDGDVLEDALRAVALRYVGGDERAGRG